MPRVKTSTKNRAGKVYKCGRCGRTIEPGEKYFSWSFRYGGTQRRCAEHYPKQSELTQSIVGEIYAAVETAETEIEGAETVEDVNLAVQGVAEAARQVFDQYTEAAEPFQGGGASGERAEELEPWVDELEGFDPDDSDPDTGERDAAIISEMEKDGFTRDDEAEWASVFDARVQDYVAEHGEPENESLENAKQEAQELIGGCPL